jgi:opacity protein-like surface antigen
MKRLLINILVLTAAVATASAAPHLGVSAGYLIDSKESLVAARAGFEAFKSGTASHQIELEVGYTSDSEFNIDLDLVPILANYRITAPLSTKMDFFGGLGLGTTRTKLSGFGLSDSGNAFTTQVFGGVAFNPSPKVAITAAARYLRIDDVELFGFKAKVGDDVSLELGLAFRF